jgi:hypothetical protein
MRIIPSTLAAALVLTLVADAAAQDSTPSFRNAYLRLQAKNQIQQQEAVELAAAKRDAWAQRRRARFEVTTVAQQAESTSSDRRHLRRRQAIAAAKVVTATKVGRVRLAADKQKIRSRLRVKALKPAEVERIRRSNGIRKTDKAGPLKIRRHREATRPDPKQWSDRVQAVKRANRSKAAQSPTRAASRERNR